METSVTTNLRCVTSQRSEDLILTSSLHDHNTRSRKKGRPWKPWTDDFEDDLKTLGISWHTVTRDWKKWRRTELEAKVCNGL
jgi:hypothetical protein